MAKVTITVISENKQKAMLDYDFRNVFEYKIMDTVELTLNQIVPKTISKSLKTVF